MAFFTEMKNWFCSVVAWRRSWRDRILPMLNVESQHSRSKKFRSSFCFLWWDCRLCSRKEATSQWTKEVTSKGKRDMMMPQFFPKNSSNIAFHAAFRSSLPAQSGLDLHIALLVRDSQFSQFSEFPCNTSYPIGKRYVYGAFPFYIKSTSSSHHRTKHLED